MSIDQPITSGRAGTRRSRTRTVALAALAALPLIATLGLAGPGAAPAAAAEPAHISGTIAGVQLDADTGLSGAYVAAYRSDDPSKVVTAELTNVTGRFTLDLPAGSYRVKAVTEARATEWWNGATSFATSATISVAAGETKTISFNLDIPAGAFTIATSPDVVGLGEVGTPATVIPGTWSPSPTSFSYQWIWGGEPIAGATSASHVVDHAPQNLAVAIIPNRAGYSEWPFFAWFLVTSPLPGWGDLLAAMDPDVETHASDALDGILPWRYATAESFAVGTRPIRGFPTDGDSYAVISTGNAAEALVPGDASYELDTYLQTPNGELFWLTDETRVRLMVKAPPGTACLALDVMFGSDEFAPGPGLGDYFTVETPTANLDEDGVPPTNNYAGDTDDGGPITVAAHVGLTAEPGWRVNGFTPALSVHVPLGGGSRAGEGYTDVIASVMDIDDMFRDSVLFIDNLRFLPAAQCRTDRIAQPIDDATPAVEGTKPVITGTAAVGKKLTAVAGAWSPAGVKLTYQWLRNGSPISGATNSTYTLRALDLLSKISVRVKGSTPGADPLTLVSASTGRVRLR